ncbi:hypothetical protein J6590_057734 [Homalodisca vitripennis]|nr:hypothetical protein J6590_057734 [Homalodisca vitripennis]
MTKWRGGVGVRREDRGRESEHGGGRWRPYCCGSDRETRKGERCRMFNYRSSPPRRACSPPPLYAGRCCPPAAPSCTTTREGRRRPPFCKVRIKMAKFSQYRHVLA